MTPFRGLHTLFSGKTSKWWYIIGFLVIAIESSIAMPLLSVGFVLLFVTSNEAWWAMAWLVVLSWWLAVAAGLSWGGVLFILWLATLAQRFLPIPTSPSQRFMLLSLVATCCIEWWRGVVWSPSYIVGSCVSIVLLLLVSRLLYVKHQTATPLVRSLSRFELFMSK